MRAMRLEHPNSVDASPLVLRDLEAPRAAEDELLLEVTVCGVCRTDLHLVEGEIHPPRYPVVPGHQVVGRIAAIGARAVTECRIGDRAGIAWLQATCGHCEYCRSGRENLCDRPTFTGFHRDGGYTQFVTARADFVYPLPEALGEDEEVAPLLCAGIIGYRAIKRARLRPGGRLALYGFGASAHIALQIARHRHSEVYVVSRSEETAARARTMGATWAGTRVEEMPTLADAAISFAPAGAVIPPALRALKKGGTLAIAGIYLDRVPPLDYERDLFEERELVSVTANTYEDASELLALAAEAGIRAEVESFELAEANEALRRLKQNRLRAQAAVLRVRG